MSNDILNRFKEHLICQNQSPHTIRNKIQYVKRFYYILEEENAQDLLNLSVETRQHAMKSLASVSKYLGTYDKWQELVKKYQLKWDQKSGYSAFEKIFNNEKNFSFMFNWIKNSVKVLPPEYSNLILFNTLTGLRPDESHNAIYLIKNKPSEYIDYNNFILSHYKFPNLFLRISKKAYMSIIDKSYLDIALNTTNISNYTSISNKIKRFGIIMNMYYCRKVFATYLRNKGIEPELIDLLQGRTPSSIFVNHYYRPDINTEFYHKIRLLLNELKDMILS